MSPDIVRLTPIMETDSQRTVIAGPNPAVVNTDFFEKSSSFPPPHPGRCDSDPVDGPSFDRNVTPDVSETLSAEHLACARDVGEVRRPVCIGVVVGLRRILRKWRAGDAKPRAL